MLQYVSCRGVDSPAGDSRLQRVSCRRLRVQDRLIPLANAHGGLTDVHGARQVAAVAAQYSTQVQYDQLVFPDSARRGTRMRQRRARSRSHNGFKGLPGSAFSAHPVADLCGDVKFRDTGTDQTNRFLHDLGTETRRIPDSIDLRGILNRAETFDYAVDGNPF